MRFDDYHRTIVGYHGTRLSVALEIVSRRRGFKYSRNRDDWLGHGVYFWEYAPQQALWWAERRKKRQGWQEPIAILGSMIRLGFCFDLLDPYNVRYLEEIHSQYIKRQSEAGLPIPQNANHHKPLDCEIFQYAYAAIQFDRGQPPDSSRAVYVPTGKGKRIWNRSWISRSAHIQVCVRNPTCILGTWLHSPTELEVTDDDKTHGSSPHNVQPENQAGGEEA